MFVLTTPEGEAYHDTSGMPVIFGSYDALLGATSTLARDSWDLLEVNINEANELQRQAFMAIYGRRAGLDV